MARDHTTSISAEGQGSLDPLTQACVAYNQAFEVTCDILGDPPPDYLKHCNEVFLGVIHESAIKASHKRRARDADPELAWVQVARAGLRRAARIVGARRGLDKMLMFSPDHENIQRDLYHSMQERYPENQLTIDQL